MQIYRVYYERGIYDGHCGVWAESPQDAIQKVDKIKNGISAYQVDEFSKKLGVYVPVWTDPEFIY